MPRVARIVVAVVLPVAVAGGVLGFASDWGVAGQAVANPVGKPASAPATDVTVPPRAPLSVSRAEGTSNPNSAPGAGWYGGLITTTGDIAWRSAVGVWYFASEVAETSMIVGSKAVEYFSQPSMSYKRSDEEMERAVREWRRTAEEVKTPMVGRKYPVVGAIAPPSNEKPMSGAATGADPAKYSFRSNTAPTSKTERIQLASATPTSTEEQTLAVVQTCTFAIKAASGDVESAAATTAALADTGLLAEGPRRLEDGAVFMPKASQRLLGLRTSRPCTRDISSSRQLIGHVVADPNSSGLVQSDQAGRIEPGKRGVPFVGMRVERGEILGYMRPTLGARERAELLGAIEDIKGQIIELELELARTRDLPLLPFRQGRLLSVRLNLDTHRRKRDALRTGLDGSQALYASASGVISQATVRAGQVVEAKEVLWEIVNPERLWIEAEGYGTIEDTEISGGHALTRDGRSLPLAYLGRGLRLQRQSVPLQFVLSDAGHGLSIGEPVNVLVRGQSERRGMVLPGAALVRSENGEMRVWTHDGPERFVSRPVRYRKLNGSEIEVEVGIKDGMRVVTRGALLLTQVR
jgi:hypothetical protein